MPAFGTLPVFNTPQYPQDPNLQLNTPRYSAPANNLVLADGHPAYERGWRSTFDPGHSREYYWHMDAPERTQCWELPAINNTPPEPKGEFEKVVAQAIKQLGSHTKGGHRVVLRQVSDALRDCGADSVGSLGFYLAMDGLLGLEGGELPTGFCQALELAIEQVVGPALALPKAIAFAANSKNLDLVVKHYDEIRTFADLLIRGHTVTTLSTLRDCLESIKPQLLKQLLQNGVQEEQANQLLSLIKERINLGSNPHQAFGSKALSAPPSMDRLAPVLLVLPIEAFGCNRGIPGICSPHYATA